MRSIFLVIPSRKHFIAGRGGASPSVSSFFICHHTNMQMRLPLTAARLSRKEVHEISRLLLICCQCLDWKDRAAAALYREFLMQLGQIQTGTCSTTHTPPVYHTRRICHPCSMVTR